jgi:hypothetical protein
VLNSGTLHHEVVRVEPLLGRSEAEFFGTATPSAALDGRGDTLGAPIACVLLTQKGPRPFRRGAMQQLLQRCVWHLIL